MKKGHCLVIRYEGPKGSPGMPEQLSPGAALIGAGLGKCVTKQIKSLCISMHAANFPECNHLI